MTVMVVIPSSLSSDGTIHTYTDDSDPNTGLDGGGHVSRLLPLILDNVTMANSTLAAAISAATATVGIDGFNTLYLGSKSVAPSLDNSGNSLLIGAMYFNSTIQKMQAWTGSSWIDTGSSINGTMNRYSYIATASQITFSAIYDIGFVDVYYNGIKMSIMTDYTATNGTTIVLTEGAVVGATIDIIGYGTFVSANMYSKTETNSLLVGKQNLLTFGSTSVSSDITALLHTTALYF